MIWSDKNIRLNMDEPVRLDKTKQSPSSTLHYTLLTSHCNMNVTDMLHELIFEACMPAEMILQ